LALANTALCFNIAMWQKFYRLVYALALANTALCFNIAMWQQFDCLVYAWALANTALFFNIAMWQQFDCFIPWRGQILRPVLTLPCGNNFTVCSCLGAGEYCALF
jgi:hypothetical protein